MSDRTDTTNVVRLAEHRTKPIFFTPGELNRIQRYYEAKIETLVREGLIASGTVSLTEDGTPFFRLRPIDG